MRKIMLLCLFALAGFAAHGQLVTQLLYCHEGKALDDVYVLGSGYAIARTQYEIFLLSPQQVVVDTVFSALMEGIVVLSDSSFAVDHVVGEKTLYVLRKGKLELKRSLRVQAYRRVVLLEQGAVEVRQVGKAKGYTDYKFLYYPNDEATLKDEPHLVFGTKPVSTKARRVRGKLRSFFYVDGAMLYIPVATASEVVFFDTENLTVKTLTFPLADKARKTNWYYYFDRSTGKHYAAHYQRRGPHQLYNLPATMNKLVHVRDFDFEIYGIRNEQLQHIVVENRYAKLETFCHYLSPMYGGEEDGGTVLDEVIVLTDSEKE